MNNKEKDKEQKKSSKKFIFTILIVIGVLMLGSTFIIKGYISKINKVAINKERLNINSQSQNNKEIDNKIDESSISNNKKEIRNIALFGIDEPDGTRGRSDSIIILTIDTINNKIKLSSIIRDSYVTIPTKEKKDKLNHAYAYGGPELAISTINKNFNLDISEFVSVNFSSLPKIIDSIGGINIEITEDELEYINDYILNLNAINNGNSSGIESIGMQKLDGNQALAYSRIRYTSGGDFERSHRQRKVIVAMADKIKELPIYKYPKILNELLPLINTNISTSDLIMLTKEADLFKADNIEENRFPQDEDGNGISIGGVYYYDFNQEVTSKKIHEFIYGNND